MKDCPLLIGIIKDIKTNFIDVKYNTYRCVLKVKKLKLLLSSKSQLKILFPLKHDHQQVAYVCFSSCSYSCYSPFAAYCISYRVVISILKKHKSCSSQQSLSPNELKNIISDIFFATEKAGLIDTKNFLLDQSVTILTNFLWSIFDAKRIQNITLMEFQLALLILCELEPLNTFQQIIESHFEIVKDFNHLITQARFEEFVNIYGKILAILGEPLYFEPKVMSEILSEAFANTPGLNGINQFTFFNLWTCHESTKFSAYTNLFLLMIRFKKSEFVVHQNECNGCKKYPIVGLRYKCQKCKNLSLCFNCFSKGFTSKRHSFGHRYFELISNEKEQSKWYAFVTKFFNVFRWQAGTIAAINNVDSSPKSDNTKLIEDQHIELMQIDDDMEGGTTLNHGGMRQRRGTIRSEIFNNSENLLILQRNLMDKLLGAIETLKVETESFKKMSTEKQTFVKCDAEMEKFLRRHATFLCDQVEMLKQIHEATVQSISSTQNNKTIKSFSSPAKSIFLPSSTPYTTKEKPKLMVDPILCKSSELSLLV